MTAQEVLSLLHPVEWRPTPGRQWSALWKAHQLGWVAQRVVDGGQVWRLTNAGVTARAIG